MGKMIKTFALTLFAVCLSFPLLAQDKYQFTPPATAPDKTESKGNKAPPQIVYAPPKAITDMNEAELKELLDKSVIDLQDERIELDFICDNIPTNPNVAQTGKQFNPGIRIYNYNKYKAMYVCLGVDGKSWIEFPEWEIIKSVKPVLGDEAIFGSTEHDLHSVTLHAEKFGVGTTLHVRGESGNLYTFFVRAIGTEEKAIPDATIFVEAKEPQGFEEKSKQVVQKISALNALDQLKTDMKEKPDYKRRKPVEWDKMECDDYEAKAQNEAGEKLNGSIRVCDDGYWVIFDLGDRSDSNRRVTFFRVIDGTDQPLRPQYHGARDQIAMVPHSGQNFTIGIGEAVICVNYRNRADKYGERS